MPRARSTSDERALGLQTPPERLRAAIALHDELVVRVERRRRVRDGLLADTRVAVTQVAMRMHALVDEGRELERDIHALMQALIDDPARPRRQRGELEEIYQALEGDVIAPRPRPGARAAGRSSPGRDPWPAGADGPRGGAPDEDEAFTPSKPRPSDRGTLRALFRRLADLLHPDKVQDEDERARRTEVMKLITVAYQDGDYARLIEIERTWATSAAIPVDGDDDELARRLAVKERAIAELQTQLAELERELRRLRASADVKLARAYERHGGADGRTPDELAAEQDLIRMRTVRDFIVGFRDGAISFERFRGGPSRPGGAHDVDDDEDDDDLFGFGPLADDPGLDPRAGHRVDPRAGAAPPDIARLIADLERVARMEGIDPRDLLRAVRAAAAGAGPGPRVRPRRR